MTGERAASSLARRLAICAGFAAAAVLFAVPWWWGLPGRDGWAYDEIKPAHVLAGWHARYSGGWNEKYPPLHYQLLGLAFRPVVWTLEHPNRESEVERTRLVEATRLVSIALALATVAGLLGLGRRLVGSPAAEVAAAFWVASPTVVYYAKTGNLETPYLFWYVLSLLALARALERFTGRRIALFGLAAAAAVATKDQAAGLYLLLPLPLLARAAAERPEGEPRLRRWLVAALDRRLWAGALVFAVALAAIYRLPWNFEGLRGHLAKLAQGVEPYRIYDRSAAGLARQALAEARNLAFVAGWPALLLAAAGAARLARDPTLRRRFAPLGASVLGYGLAFLLPIGFVYDRFLLPLAIPVVALAGLGATTLLATRRLPAAFARAALVAALVYSVARSIDLDGRMLHDARVEATRWIAERSPAGAVVGAVAVDRKVLPPVDYLLQWSGLKGKAPAELRRLRLDYLLAIDTPSRPGSDFGLRRALARGRLGFHEIQRFEPPQRAWLLDFRHAVSNLEAIDPPVVVYAPLPGLYDTGDAPP
jgi:hypothetical protein